MEQHLFKKHTKEMLQIGMGRAKDKLSSILGENGKDADDITWAEIADEADEADSSL